jgi:RNA polymerase sigma-70 factor, ECF subfamily
MLTDEKLMLKYQAGDEMAFNELYRKFSSQVYGYAQKRLSPHEVDDFFQKVWRQLHEKRHLYDNQPFAPWFFVLIRHLLIDEYRSSARKNRQDQHEEVIERLYQVSTRSEQEIEHILAELPIESAALIRQHYLDGISYEELGKQMGLTSSNLRQRLSRTLRGLRLKLKDQEL